MRVSVITLTVLTVLAAATCGPALAAEPPGLVNYQGVLRDAADAALDGTHDMIFRFYDAAGDASCNGGALLLTDSHSGAGAVTVSGGMFNAWLGGGVITPGAESSLTEVFRDNAGVYLEVEVEGELLCPRVRVTSAGYALNADHLEGHEANSFGFVAGANAWSGANTFSNPANSFTGDGSGLTGITAGSADLLDGLDSSQLLRSDTSDTYSSGTLTIAGGATLDGAGTVQAGRFYDRDDTQYWVDPGLYSVLKGLWIYDQNVFLNRDGPDGDMSLRFYDAGSEFGQTIAWDDSGDRFYFSNDIHAVGAVDASAFQDSGDPSFVVDLDGTSSLNVLQIRDSALYLNHDGPDQDAGIYFFDGSSPTARWFGWDDGLGHFRANAGLYTTYNMTAGVFRDADDTDFRLDPNLYSVLNGLWIYDQNVFLNRDGPEGDMSLRFYDGGSEFGQTIAWDDSADRFYVSDDIHANGAVIATSLEDLDDGAFSLDPNGITALNTLQASKVYDRDSTAYWLDPGETDSGHLYGDLYIGHGSNADNDTLWFDQGLAWMRWDNATSMFRFSSDLRAFRYVDGNSTAYWLDPSATDSGHLYGSLRIGHGSGSDDDALYFDQAAESLLWRNASARFELSDDLYTAADVTAARFVDAANSVMVADPAGTSRLQTVQINASSTYLNYDGPDGDTWLYFYDGASATGEQLGWDDSDDRFTMSDDLYIDDAVIGVEAYGATMGGRFFDSNASGWAWIAYHHDGISAHGNEQGGYFQDQNSSANAHVAYDTYKIQGTGTVSFVQNHPEDQNRVIVYVAPEGDEAATYTRGTARLVAGEASVPLGETFRWVTNPDIGLTAYLTPHGDCGGLYVESLSTTELVVRELGGGASDVTFDYIVYGLRLGFEEQSIVQEKKEEARIPSMDTHRDLYSRKPDLRAFSALERYKGMEVAAGLAGKDTGFDFSASETLRAAVAEFDPSVHELPRSASALGVAGQGGEAGAGDAEAMVPPDGASAATGDPLVAAAGAAPQSVVPMDAEGNVYARSFRPSASDLASLAPVAETVEAGDVLVIDPALPGLMGLSRVAADTRVFGIVAGEPGVVLGATPPAVQPRDATGESTDPVMDSLPDASEPAQGSPAQVPVALSGVALCKVDAGYGSILPGDLLTTSPTPGHAMRAADPLPGTILGKALESLDAGAGPIRVLVMLR